jgi:hypothetical protein
MNMALQRFAEHQVRMVAAMDLAVAWWHPFW